MANAAIHSLFPELFLKMLFTNHYASEEDSTNQGHTLEARLKDKLSQCFMPKCGFSFLWAHKSIKNLISLVCSPSPLKGSDRHNTPVRQWFAKGWILRDRMIKRKESQFSEDQEYQTVPLEQTSMLVVNVKKYITWVPDWALCWADDFGFLPSSSLHTSNFRHCVGGLSLREQTDILLMVSCFL